MTEPRVLYLPGDENGPALWRVFSPAKALTQHGYVAVWRPKDATQDVFAYLAQGFFNLVILPRLSWSDQVAATRFMANLRRAGAAVVYECDDDTFSPSITLRQHLTLQRDKSLEELENERQWRITSMQRCDAITVSTPHLKVATMNVFDGPVEIIPNAIDTDFWTIERQRFRAAGGRKIRHLTVGWSGGGRYADDLLEVAEAWRRIARRYPDVHFVVQGTSIEALVEAVPAERLHLLPWMDIDWSVAKDGKTMLPPYPWGVMEIDIGCCAVAPRLFNVSKSVIKFYEYTYAGAACVVSPTLYGPAVTHGETALIANSADEWEAHLSHLVESRSLRRKLRRAAREHIRAEHSMATQWYRWVEAYSRILDHVQAHPKLLLAV